MIEKLGKIRIDLDAIPRWVIIVLDLLISLFALGLAYIIRFNFYAENFIHSDEWDNLMQVLPYVLLLKGIIFYFFKIHQGLIRHTSIEDVKRIFNASITFSVILFFAGLARNLIFGGHYILPTSIIIVEFFFSLVFIIGLRFTFKVLYFELKRPKEKSTNEILIFGAGVSGLIAKRTIERSPDFHSKIVGFIDDNPNLSKNRLEGTPIFHTSKLESIIEKYSISELIVAIQNPNKENMAAIVELCLLHSIKVKRVPDFNKWINGEFSLKQIRKINIDDLLGRDPISLDRENLKQQIENQTVLITGAAGSIGSEITRQVLKYAPKKLVIVDQWESGLYDFHIDLLANGKGENLEVIIGDVREFKRMENVFTTFSPTIVFHAAAYKHVPLMEDNPSEAIKTNVLGTKNMVDLCDKFHVKKMVMISTDKAVNPTNIMGASKRIAEIYAQTKNTSSKTQFITTRFGNVLGSNGSVIPLFKKQIEHGGPITVTHPDVVRYFMTIPEACQLVLEAGTMGKGGEIFVFDMGNPVKIMDLAKKMISLSGLELGKDIEIRIIGLRPGEKLYEELLADKENTLPTHHPQILRAHGKDNQASICNEIQALIDLFDSQNNDSIVRKMKEIVPEFISNNSIYTKLDK